MDEEMGPWCCRDHSVLRISIDILTWTVEGNEMPPRWCLSWRYLIYIRSSHNSSPSSTTAAASSPINLHRPLPPALPQVLRALSKTPGSAFSSFPHKRLFEKHTHALGRPCWANVSGGGAGGTKWWVYRERSKRYVGSIGSTCSFYYGAHWAPMVCLIEWG